MSFMRLPFRHQRSQNQTGAPTHLKPFDSGESGNPGSKFWRNPLCRSVLAKIKGLNFYFLFPSLIQDVNTFDNNSIISTLGLVFAVFMSGAVNFLSTGFRAKLPAANEQGTRLGDEHSAAVAPYHLRRPGLA